MDNLLNGLGNDIRFSLRVLMRNRLFAAACIVTLALGVGTTTAVFSVIDATLLRPLPYRDPTRLVALNVITTGSWDGDLDSLYVPSQVEMLRWRKARSVEAVEGLEPRLVALSGSGEPEVVNGGAVSSGLFRMFGVEPSLGRTFTDDEEQRNIPLAVVSDSFVRRRLANLPSPLGATVTLDSVSYQIVGVMPAGFHPFNDPAEVFIPLHATDDLVKAGNRIMYGAARLRDGATLAQAQQEMTAISEGITKDYPTSNTHARPMLRGLREQIYGSQRLALFTMGAAAALLLLLACVNVVNLTAGHIALRQAEFSVRAALGGSRRQIARLQLVETSILSLAGGALGIGVMNAIVTGLIANYTHRNAVALNVTMDWRVASFAAFVIVAVAVISALVPAWRTDSPAGASLARASASARTGHGPRERRVRTILVASQVALAVVLLCGAGIFLKSLDRLLAINPGFSPDRVWSAQIRLSPVNYPNVQARATFVSRMLERISAIPGVQAAGTTQTTFQPSQSMQTLAWVDGKTIDAQHLETLHIRHITPGYFTALRIGVAEGRAIDDRDQLGAAMVCMVNARFAKQYWPASSAVGHRLKRAGATSPWLTIVGVAADVMDNGLGIASAPTIYLPYLQQNTSTARISLVVRTANDAPTYAREIEGAVWSLDPTQPLDGLRPLPKVISESTGDERFRTTLMAIFAALGLILAIVGVYGVTSASITARTREMGVRMALGATASDVIGNVVGGAARMVSIGAAIGLASFFALGRLTASLLYGTSYAEPLILALATLPLIATVLAISYWQARRLTEVNLIQALRNDG